MKELLNKTAVGVALLIGLLFPVNSVVFAAEAPEATATNASSITQTSATLNGVVNPNGVSTDYWMEISLGGSVVRITTRYGAGNGSSNVSVSQTITNLTPGTTYSYVIKAKNANDVVGVSNSRTFTTSSSSNPVSAPSVAATGASSVTQTSAVLSGTVNPNGVSTDYWMEISLGGSVVRTTTRYNVGSGSSNVPVSQTVTGLSSSTTYSYVIKAKNTADLTSTSNSGSFTTQGGVQTPDMPDATATGASSVGQNSATLNGVVIPNGLSTEVWFEYGTNNNFQYLTSRNSIGSGYNSVSANRY
ncbi:MAG: hypothetical protein PHP35_01595, partial [Candidatus Colwellbacteria bacterium]|nr:hypothetical protein [Candidatus Colwellbacteria bacterium]